MSVASTPLSCLLAALVLLSGCSSGQRPPDSGKQSSRPGQTGVGGAIQSQPITLKRKARIDLLAVNRLPTRIIEVRFRVVNEDNDTLRIINELANGETSLNTSGVTLVDGSFRYYPLRDSSGRCRCSYLPIVGNAHNIGRGQAQEMSVHFPDPPTKTVDRITVVVPRTPPFLDVPVTNATEAALESRSGEADPRSVTAFRLGSVVDDLSGEKSTDDDGDNVNVRLSTDVLFAVNKYDLTPRAKEILREVAAKIDAAKGPAVKISGHADSTGNDAINDPLSRNRAAAVEAELKRLVTRTGVTFQSAGYGSRRPIADNATAEGRQRNRRVTVRFAQTETGKDATDSDAPSRLDLPPTPEGWVAPPPKALAAPVPSPLPVIASGTLGGGKAEVNGVRRDSTGLVTVTWTLTNLGSKDFLAWTALRNRLYWKRYGLYNTAGVTVTDTQQALRHHPLIDPAERCLCTEFSLQGDAHFRPGQSRTFFQVYKVAPEAKTVTVEVPGFAAIKDVPIS